MESAETALNDCNAAGKWCKSQQTAYDGAKKLFDDAGCKEESMSEKVEVEVEEAAKDPCEDKKMDKDEALNAMKDARITFKKASKMLTKCEKKNKKP